MGTCFRPALLALLTASATVLAQAPASAPADPLWVELPVEKHETAPGRWSIPLNMEETAGVERIGEPVRGGVPVPRGVLRDLQQLRLEDASGRECPLQVETTATWPDGSIKWLLLDFKADVKARAKTAYTLSFGKGVSRSAAASPLSARQDAETITVDTGVLKFTMPRNGNVFIGEAWLDRNGDGVYADDERLVAPPERGEFRGLFVDLWHPKYGAGAYWAALDPKPEEARIETVGPNCVELVFKGWHRSTAQDLWSFVGRASWRYTLRIRAYAGRATLRVSHTFINTEDPLDIRVRAIGIRLPVQAGPAPRYAFGSTPALQKTGGTNTEFYLVQEHWNRFIFEQGGPLPSLKAEPGGDPVELLGQYQGGTIVATGTICEGWADCSGPAGGLTVAFRDMPKLFPKELGVQGNALVAGIWPAHKRPTVYEFFGGGQKSFMDLRQPNEIQYPDVVLAKTRYPEFYNKWMIGTDSDWERYQTWPNRCNALGVAKTHELIYDFHAGPVNPARARALAAAASDPLQPYVTSQWYCWETEALGRLQPHDPTNFPAMEAQAGAFMDWLSRHQNEWSHLWGIFDYGCVQTFRQTSNGVARAEDYPYAALGPWGKLAGRFGWLNGEYNNDHDAFLHYFRSGRYADFKFAAAYAAHRMDVDTCHYNTDPAWVGAQHRHSILHWSDWLIDQQTFLDGIVDLYYTTGDRRARDVALEVAGFSMYARLPLRYFREKPGAGGTTRYPAHRGTWNKITNIARAYEMTADPEMRSHLEAWIKVIEANLHPWGGPVGENQAYLGASFPLVYQVTDSPAMAKIIAGTGFADGVGTLGTFAPYSAMRYRLTKDAGPFMAQQVWGLGWHRRKGATAPEWHEVGPDTFTTGRTTPILGWPHMMSAVYDARFDDRSPPSGAPNIPPAPLPTNQHYECVSLRTLLNEDPFGDMRTGKGLPWLSPASRANRIAETLGRIGGTLTVCGSGVSGFANDQSIADRLQPGEAPLTTWSIYPTYVFEPPMTRSFTPRPPLLLWGSLPFAIPDPAFNNGKGVIAVKGGDSVVIPVGRKAQRLTFLGHVFSLRYAVDPGDQAVVPFLARSEVGRYRLRFADGSVRDVPIVTGVNASGGLYGYPNAEAPFVLGAPGGTLWPPSGGICAFTLECGNKAVESITFSGSDANKALYLWAVTAVVDGPSDVRPVKTVLFGSRHAAGEGVDALAASTVGAAGKSGWLNAAGVQDDGVACGFPDDGTARVVRVSVPENGWYRCAFEPVLQRNRLVLNVEANGRLALWSSPWYVPSPCFYAKATNGLIDLRLMTRPFALEPQASGLWMLRALRLARLAGEPPEPPARLDLDKALRYGWDAHAEPNVIRGGGLYDHILRFDVLPGGYRLQIKLTHRSISSPAVRCDVYAQDKLVLDNLPVTMQTPASFELAAPEGRIKLRIALDATASGGRIQEWALDRIVLERLR